MVNFFIYTLNILFLFCNGLCDRFHPYYMDQTDQHDLQYDCLYYRASDNIREQYKQMYTSKKPYQIIPYCIRPKVDIENVKEDNLIDVGDISSILTFASLREKQITTWDLLKWSAAIDLIEFYDEYLTLPSNDSLAWTKFYNCSEFWFGSYCQYTFKTYPRYNLSLSFDTIVGETFRHKIFLKPTSMTCYIHLKCNRGPAPACLDWREICDGKVDCFDSDIDEIGCFLLELNECQENEFRCHMGLCIPEEFLLEGLHFADCLDFTDEYELSNRVTFGKAGFLDIHCGNDPGFWCEESDSTRHSRTFVCGDGSPTSQALFYTIKDWVTFWSCKNGRDRILKQALFSFDDRADLSYDCWLLLSCSTVGYIDLDCSILCEDTECLINVTDKCSTDYAIFPQRAIFQGHIRLVYQTNKTIIFTDGKISMFPDYVCYNERKCPFLPSISLLNINGTTCRSTEEFHLHQFSDIQRFFQACFTVLDTFNSLEQNSTALIQCPGTTKYISKHRILDSHQDCYQNTDETTIDACVWKDKYRFKCLSENKCISFILVRNIFDDCFDGADEQINTLRSIQYSKVCNGYEHLSPVVIHGLNETDETHCQHWPCNNMYTRCDGAWNCLNGADELNCEPIQCPLNTHECVSFTGKEITCLPIELAGNGIVDCLGATDEREFCRKLQPTNVAQRYKCLNESLCMPVLDGCRVELCLYPKGMICSDQAIETIVRLLNADEKLKKPQREYFFIDSSSLMTARENLTVGSSLSHLFGTTRTELCMRGVLIYTRKNLSMTCLCPPSYYGNRCQYQSQRVSLTIQLTQICNSLCTGIYAMIVSLIDEDHIIHDYEQFTYISTYECQKKFFIYLLYRIRSKNATKIYHIQIDAYHKINVTYYSSWILPVNFSFLPVNRVAANLYIPANSVVHMANCSKSCVHGQCMTYINQPNQQFCHCLSNWSGVNCTIPLSCNCHQDSHCYEKKNNRSICICPLNKYGQRCRLFTICHNDTCQNGGQCISDDQRISRNQLICLCPQGFFGIHCQWPSSKIEITFKQLEIPRSLRIHFLAVEKHGDPLHTIISTKIPFDRDFAEIYISVSFHLIITQLSTEYYLIYINSHYNYSSLRTLSMTSKQQCLHTNNFFHNETIRTYPLLYRVKYYHLFCRNHSQLKCFHDNEEYMCLCNEERFANCFPFNFQNKSTCKKTTDCLNGGQCFSERPYCPHSVSCVCTDCFYGSKCQFTSKGFGLSLDMILGYHIRPKVSIPQQPIIVKTSIGLTVLMFIFGIFNSILSIITFRKRKAGEPGCRQYLLAISIISLFIIILFSIKLLMLILSQLSIIVNMIVLKISCISIDCLLRLCLIIADWFAASVSIERLLTITLGIKFNKEKSRNAVKWTISSIVLVGILSILHDPIYRTIIYDNDEDRRWCIVQYPSAALEIYNSVINIIHFFVPFGINFLVGLLIIFFAARTRSAAHPDQTYSQVLKQQFSEYKHLIMSSLSLVLLATPRLVISFTSGCMKSPRNSSLYLAGYFISFIPSCLTFFTFILPSKLYMENFTTATKRITVLFKRKQ